MPAKSPTLSNVSGAVMVEMISAPTSSSHLLIGFAMMAATFAAMALVPGIGCANGRMSERQKMINVSSFVQFASRECRSGH
jgi:hypothetical protein